jgi:hypothetical protein
MRAIVFGPTPLTLFVALLGPPLLAGLGQLIGLCQPRAAARICISNAI